MVVTSFTKKVASSSRTAVLLAADTEQKSGALLGRLLPHSMVLRRQLLRSRAA